MKDAIYTQTLLTGLVERQPMPLAQVKAAAKEVLLIVKDGLLRDGSVRIQNFGTFKLKYVAEHQGRNPQTGQAITIKAQNRVVFTPAKALRELIEPNRAKAIPVSETKAASQAVVRPVIPVTSSAPPQVSERAHAALTAMPEQAVKSVPATELAQPIQADKQNIKSNRKIYFLGTGSVLIIVLLIFLSQKDQEISSQPIIAKQTVAPIIIQSTPAAPVQQKITTIDTVEEQSTTDIAQTTHTPPVTSAIQKEEKNTFFFTERNHILVYGDSLWKLAEHNYGDALLWTHIYQANQDSIRNPDRLREKYQITLPSLQGSVDALTQEDRYHIAEGYYLAYLHYKAIGNKDSFFALLEAKRYSAKLVKEKMSSLNLSLAEKLLLKHQSNL